MNQAQFLQCLRNQNDAGIEQVKAKNHDYAGEEDPFKNFRFAPMIGVTVEQAMLVRILDKVARVGNLLQRPGEVKDESMDDTMGDLQNYAGIFRAYRKSLKETPKSENGKLEAGVIEALEIALRLDCTPLEKGHEDLNASECQYSHNKIGKVSRGACQYHAPIEKSLFKLKEVIHD